MRPIRIHRHEATLLPDSARVILRPFIPGDVSHVTTTIGRALALTKEEVVDQLGGVR